MSTNPEDILKNPEQIKQLINLLSGLLPSDSDSSDEKPKTRKRTTRKKTVSTSKKQPKKPQRENKFTDMPESQMFKEDPALAKKLYKQPPMRRRPKKGQTQAQCRICGKKENVSPGLLFGGIERFKCNKCSATPG